MISWLRNSCALISAERAMMECLLVRSGGVRDGLGAGLACALAKYFFVFKDTMKL